jgi:hypothetical protein
MPKQNFAEFIATWDGRYNNFDNGLGPQCVDLVNQYVQDVLGGKPWGGNAVDKWENYPKDFYDRIPATEPAKEGDIVIWNGNINSTIDQKTNKKIPGLGHIAALIRSWGMGFESFDQKWPVGSPCSIQQHYFTHVLGYLRPKSNNQPMHNFVSAFKSPFSPDIYLIAKARSTEEVTGAGFDNTTIQVIDGARLLNQNGQPENYLLFHNPAPGFEVPFTGGQVQVEHYNSLDLAALNAAAGAPGNSSEVAMLKARLVQIRGLTE